MTENPTRTVPECRPDFPINPPAAGWNSNTFHPDCPGGFLWMDGQKKPDPLETMTKPELIQLIHDMRRQHAEEWLQKDDDIQHLQALNASLAKRALLAETPPATLTETGQHMPMNCRNRGTTQDVCTQLFPGYCCSRCTGSKDTHHDWGKK